MWRSFLFHRHLWECLARIARVPGATGPPQANTPDLALAIHRIQQWAEKKGGWARIILAHPMVEMPGIEPGSEEIERGCATSVVARQFSPA